MRRSADGRAPRVPARRVEISGGTLVTMVKDRSVLVRPCVEGLHGRCRRAALARRPKREPVQPQECGSRKAVIRLQEEAEKAEMMPRKRSLGPKAVLAPRDPGRLGKTLDTVVRAPGALARPCALKASTVAAATWHSKARISSGALFLMVRARSVLARLPALRARTFAATACHDESKTSGGT